MTENEQNAKNLDYGSLNRKGLILVKDTRKDLKTLKTQDILTDMTHNRQFTRSNEVTRR